MADADSDGLKDRTAALNSPLSGSVYRWKTAHHRVYFNFSDGKHTDAIRRLARAFGGNAD